jgi:hypothetical protein
MPESGGPTTQSGILFQNSIAALFLGRLCDAITRPENERVIHVRVETPDDVDDIVITFADNHKSFIQAKEDVHVGDSSWRQVWQDFNQQFLNNKFQKDEDRLALWVGSYRSGHTALQGLCQRAISSDNFEEWQTRINEDQKALLEKIKPLLSPEILEDSILLSFFRHIEIEIHPFETLERDESPHWMPETNYPPKTLYRLFRDRLGGASRIRGNFTSNTLKSSLIAEDPALKFSKPTDIDEIKGAIKACSSLLRLQKNSIGNTNIHIRRNIVDEIVNWIISTEDDTKNLAMLIDQAGTGKTVALQDVLIDLENKDYDVLAIKADQQLSGITNFSDISGRLGLGQSPEQILGHLSQLGRVIVLIDQIDALSLSLAHDQTTLDIVLDFIARLRWIPNLKILISCRLFDRNSDPRLKQIDLAQQFTLSQFTEDEVSRILEAVKISYRDLARSTQILLQTPLHLNLFTIAFENYAGSREKLLGVTSLQELYGAIWENIVLREDSRAPSKADRVEVLRFLKNYMAQHQLISVPKSALLTPELAHLEPATSWLASTGILIAGKSDWTFIHQTFFDYCYAREFVEQGGDLVKVILSSDQGLFLRPQLIQVITYMRGTNASQYLRELTILLSATSLRYHLYDLLLRWFASLPNPTDEEWHIAQHMLISKEQRNPILQRMFGNPGWFERLQNTFLPQWLSNEKAIDETILLYLVSIADIEVTQPSAINLLRPFLGKSEEWDKRLIWIVSRIRNWHSHHSVDFYEQVNYRMPLLNRQDIYQIGLVSKAFPQSGARLLRFLLNLVLSQYDDKLREWQKLESEGVATLSFGPSIYSELHTIENHSLEEVFHFVSRAEPRKYIEVMVPWLDNMLARRKMLEEISPYYYIWDDLSGNWYNDHEGIEHAFIFSLIDALVSMARSDASYFDSVITHLSQSPFRTPQLLITHVFKAVPEIFASKALRFILADRKRLELGDVDDYDSRKLIQTIYPYLSDHERVQLEEFILQPPLVHKNRGLEGLRWRGIEQFHLLQSIPQEFLSKKAVERLNEWEHKFPGSKPVDDPITVRGGSVKSPITAEIAQKMTDLQWEKAMNKYHGAIEHRDFLKGGAEQLSRVLQTLVKETPQRYFSLLQKVNDDVDDAYVDAYLNGLAESTAPAEWLFSTVRRFCLQPNRNFKRTIAWSIEKRVKEGIPIDLIDLFLGYVHGDSGEDEWWWAKGDDHGDVFSSFLNSDRGAAFSALMRIYDGQNNEEAYSKKWELIDFVESDPSTALRIGAIHELTYMIRLDRDRAINSFEKLFQGHEILLETTYTREFIYWAFYKNYLRFRPYIIAMMHNPKDEVQEQGAQLACIAGISNTSMESEEAFQTAQDLAEQTTTESASLPWKRGAAIIYTHNITGNPKDICVMKLSNLLNEEDKQIHDSVGRVFYSLQEEHIYSLRGFIETYAKQSKSPNHKFAEYLLDFGLLDPEWTLSVLYTILNNSALINGDTPWSMDVEDIIRLVLRIYTYPTVSDEIRKRSMDLFDILMEKSPGFSQKVLSEWDQR